MINAAANFWISRATYDQQRSSYEIFHLTGPNEAITNVNNDSYTNALAEGTLEAATEAARRLEETPNAEWASVSRKILIPFDASRQVHVEHSGDEQGKYAHALVLLAYPLGMKFSKTIERNDLAASLKNFGKPGYDVGMMGNIYSILASQLGNRDLAYRLFLSMIRSYAQPPFGEMTETPSNGRAVFLTAEGGFLQQVIFGFTGLRLTDDGLKSEYPPLLPPTWQSLELKGIHLRGRSYDIRVTSANKLESVAEDIPVIAQRQPHFRTVSVPLSFQIWAMIVNPFFSPVIRIQAERSHRRNPFRNNLTTEIRRAILARN